MKLHHLHCLLFFKRPMRWLMIILRTLLCPRVRAIKALLFGILQNLQGFSCPDSSITTTYPALLGNSIHMVSGKSILNSGNLQTTILLEVTHLLKNICRRKPMHSHSLVNLASLPTLTESERQGYNDYIERLKHDKEPLHLEVQRHKQDRDALELQMQGLTERLQNVERNHKNMLSSLALTMDQPAVTLNLKPQMEICDRKRISPGTSYLYNETNKEDDHMESSQNSSRENINMTSLLNFNKELLEKLESSLRPWENIVLDIVEGLLHYGASLELDESTFCADNLTISSTRLNFDVGSKTCWIDMNSGPDPAISPEMQPFLGEQLVGMATNTRMAVNDVFWEHFLTENPGSNDESEFQSERKDTDESKNENKVVDHGKKWRNLRSVNNLVDQLGNHTPAERT